MNQKRILEGQRAVVTGAFGTLGMAVARRFAEHGASVALLDIMPEPPAAAREQFSAPHLLLGGVDLTRLESVAAAMSRVQSHLGGIDVLVNVAGGFRWQTLEDGSADTWDFLYAINLKTAVTTCKAALPIILAKGGRASIINIGAGAAAKSASAGMGAYTASKAGVQRLTESLSEELKDRGITVNVVLPGTIDTPQNRAAMPDADTSRWVDPAAIADVIVFLASAAARAVTGAAIPVFGRG